jgi:histone H3/H4
MLETIISITIQSRRKTVSKEDVIKACSSNFIKVVIPTHGKDLIAPKRCKVLDSSMINVKMKDGEVMKRGEFSKQAVEFYQRQSSTCVQIAVKPFRRLVKELSCKYNSNLLFTADATGIMQVTLEQYMVELFESTNRAAEHAGRKSIQPRDMQFVLGILQC